MVSTIVSILALATAVLAHPQRHHRFHYATGTGDRGSGIALPTGGAFSANGTDHRNGTHFGNSSAIESQVVTAVETITVSPIPLASATDDVAVSSVDAAAANAAVSSGSSSCTSSLTSTITSTSIQFVTYTAQASDLESDAAVAASGSSAAAVSTTSDNGLASLTGSASVDFTETAAAGAFFGRPQHGNGASSVISNAGAGASSVVQSVVPTTLATIATAASASSGYGASVSVVASVSGGSGGSSSTSSASSSGSTGGSTSTSGKKGLSYNDASLTSAFAGKGISWAYNWGASPDGTIVSGAEYVPLLWGLSSTSAWASAASAAIASGSKHALSFNEPDLASQSNIDPQTAATNHIKYMNPLADQVEIGSPAITNGAGTSPLMGIDWLNSFFTACAGNCKVDFVAFHWYASASAISDFKSHVNAVIKAAADNGVSKVWLTEFGASGSDSDVASFLSEAVEFLDSTDAVERYAYFMCSDGILVNGNSISSPIGTAYA
ncbi:hypothetical protein HRR83_009296 [Exophiala dermatitidis]|uniref:Asl1-like glycosyl hydrolase catalytic domain-containing protein n=2 Tax=Exophiala dermatitidis TaxID=5970 RepID=H6C9I6_EXODN|nr:uncharacterized protein HMPREF1120_07873 [Exophiala dermatitidis NIH/UT8656]KAJ4502032.1 hypothetical protein HRR75_008718 [Exophiala dermatitidis]EHY59895.1 hypothetical protein HMPREF1120_07873 [Exophiala dermatitidis NIH/UT8656]KAJ4502380.1 hypothetical protein HRR73_009451 [Exophiala dermatitidis]KAJ4502935.1 hypothetical protein HRR74_009475 [Exophiala dermatitidis]KAJ4530397.1 hypothetical protein HRR76_008114 [Exophiala dermatitidis]